jgi:hypothetical protein
MYDVEILIRRSAFPLRITRVCGEARVFEIIENALAAWGIPVPVSLRNVAEFASLLAERGSYEGGADDAKLLVKRCA